MIGVSCSNCQKTYRLGDGLAGKQFNCQNCGTTVIVPSSASVSSDKAEITPSALPRQSNLGPAIWGLGVVNLMLTACLAAGILLMPTAGDSRSPDSDSEAKVTNAHKNEPRGGDARKDESKAKDTPKGGPKQKQSPVHQEPANEIERLIGRLRSQDRLVRLNAAKQLGLLGIQAKPAAAALTRVLNDDGDDEVRAQAKQALQRIDEAEAAEYFVKLQKRLQSRDSETRTLALQELATRGAKAEQFGRLICTALLDESQDVKQQAVETLMKVNPEIFRHALTLVTDSDANNRVRAAELLGQIGDKARPTIPLILNAIKTGRERAYYFEPLVSIDPDDPLVVQSILSYGMNEGDDFFSRRDQLAALAACPKLLQGSEKTQQAVQKQLIVLLNELRRERATQGGQFDRLQACVLTIQLLSRAGPGAKDAVPALKAFRLDSDENVREAAVEALKAIEGE